MGLCAICLDIEGRMKAHRGLQVHGRFFIESLGHEVSGRQAWHAQLVLVVKAKTRVVVGLAEHYHTFHALDFELL